MARMEIVTGIERRRRWSDDEKLRILAEADEPGARIADVARRHDIYPAQMRVWRQTLSPPAFAPVNIVERDGVECGQGWGAARPPVAKPSMVEISLRNGRALKALTDIDRRTQTSLIQCVEAA